MSSNVQDIIHVDDQELGNYEVHESRVSGVQVLVPTE